MRGHRLHGVRVHALVRRRRWLQLLPWHWQDAVPRLWRRRQGHSAASRSHRPGECCASTCCASAVPVCYHHGLLTCWGTAVLYDRYHAQIVSMPQNALLKLTGSLLARRHETDVAAAGIED